MADWTSKLAASLCLMVGFGIMSPAFGISSADPLEYAEEIVTDWLEEPVLVEAIKDQNDTLPRLSPAEIDELDLKWRIETASKDKPMIQKVLERELSARIKALVAESKGVITQVIVMDNQGLVVAMDQLSVDYWQGDEEKWRRTFLKGPDAVFTSAVDHDASTDRFESEVSFSVMDPDTGEAIGAIAMGIDVKRLEDLGL